MSVMRGLIFAALLGPALGSSGDIAKHFRSGVAEYSGILAHLTGDLIDQYVLMNETLVENLQGWAGQLGGKARNMHAAFQQSETAAKKLVGEQNKRLESLAAQSSRLDASIAQQDKAVAGLQAQVSGKQQELNMAQKNLVDAQNSLNSHQRAVDEAQKKYDKTKNKCITGRRRKREADRVLRRQKRGWFKKLRRAVAKPFKSVGRALERGVCRGVGSLTGRIKKMKNLRNKAQNARNAAQSTLNAKRAQLNALNAQLNNSRNQLNAARGQRNSLEQQRNKLRKELKSSSKVSQDLKAATMYVASLVVPGKALTEAMTKIFLLDVSTLIDPLNKAADLLTKELKAGSLPHLPRPGPQQLATIKANLDKFSANLGDYPLLIV